MTARLHQGDPRFRGDDVLSPARLHQGDPRFRGDDVRLCGSASLPDAMISALAHQHQPDTIPAHFL